MTVARLALPVAVDQLFDYWVPDGSPIVRGSLVRARLGRRSLPAVVMEIAETTDVERERLAPIEEIANLPPLANDVVDVAQFVASYYLQPIGMALSLAVPPYGERAPVSRLPPSVVLVPDAHAMLADKLARAPSARRLFERLRDAGPQGLGRDHIAALSAHDRRTLHAWHAAGHVTDATSRSIVRRALNDEQRAAVDAIRDAAGAFAPIVLQGVTGSGKTDVYLAAASAAIASGRQVLVLVPEINLTPQLEARVRDALPDAAAVSLHSGLSAGARRANWSAAANGRARLVMGTRLSVFTPLPDLGLIVVDEEHDTSYKQQDGVRYHARDVAVWRARHRGVPVVLCSATPSLETYAGAASGRYERVALTRRADPRAAMPHLAFVPNRDARSHEGISGALRDAIDACLARGEQALVFVNRRGFSPSLKCSACAWEAQCPRCSARLTLHRDPPALNCHHCGHHERVPRACPECGTVDLFPQGFGTQRLERALATAFPGARIARVDRDSTRAKDAFARVRADVEDRAIDLLVGTQMLAKGHDFPRLTLVGVLGADNALYSADFRATERLTALLMQVAGRAGRAGLAGQVIVQTDFPNHAVYEALARHDYDGFASELLEQRRALSLPPSTHAALLLADAHRRADVDAYLDAAHVAASALLGDARDIEVFPPVPALLARRAGYERGQMLVQGARRSSLQRFLARWRQSLDAIPASRVRAALDVDPASFG